MISGFLLSFLALALEIVIGSRNQTVSCQWIPQQVSEMRDMETMIAGAEYLLLRQEQSLSEGMNVSTFWGNREWVRGKETCVREGL